MNKLRELVLKLLEYLHLQVQGGKKKKRFIYCLTDIEKHDRWEPIGFAKGVFQAECGELELDGYGGVRVIKDVDGTVTIEARRLNSDQWETLSGVRSIGFDLSADDLIATVRIESIIWDNTFIVDGKPKNIKAALSRIAPKLEEEV